MARRTVPGRALALVCAAALLAAAAAAPLKITASDCAGINAAFTQFGAQLAAATSARAQSMILTISCNGTYAGCTTSTLSYSPPALPKQPPISITVQADRKCSVYGSQPVLSSTSPNTLFFTIDKANIGASKFAFTLKDLAFDGPVATLDLPANQTTSVTLQNLDVFVTRGPNQQYPIWVKSQSKIKITDCAWRNTTNYPAIELTNPHDVTIKNNAFANSDAGFIEVYVALDKVKVDIVSNIFSDSLQSTYGTAMYMVTQGAKKVQVNFRSNTFITDSLDNPVVCLFTNGLPNATDTRYTFRANQFLNVTKPWGTTQNCNMGALNGIPINNPGH